MSVQDLPFAFQNIYDVNVNKYDGFLFILRQFDSARHLWCRTKKTTLKMEKIKNIRSRKRNTETRLFRKFGEAKETMDFERDELLSTYDNLTQQKQLLEKLNEQMLEITDSPDVVNKIVGTVASYKAKQSSSTQRRKPSILISKY